MRAYANNLALLLRPQIIINTTFTRIRKQIPGCGRRLHSDVVNVAPVTPAPAAEARAPLTDLLGRRHDYLRISLTERCNLRCQYCMPAEGVPLSPRAALLARDELARTVRVLAACGVRKVRLTGGEPTLRADLSDIIQDISSIEGISTIAMTTNGLVLTRRLPSYQRAGLNAINVSLDSLRAERYEHMARRPGLSRVLAGIDLALQLGYRPVKINVVLMKGFNDDEIGDFVEYTRDREVEVRFIEFMPFSGNAWDDSKLVPHRAAVKTLMTSHPEAAPMLPRPNDTARVWQVPGYAGSVGFISSMTNNFCSTCNRLRITADGNLKVCLFGAAEISLRDALRAGASDEELEDLIRTALRNKKPQHAARDAAPRATDTAPQTSEILVPSAGFRKKASRFPLRSAVKTYAFLVPSSVKSSKLPQANVKFSKFLVPTTTEPSIYTTQPVNISAGTLVPSTFIKKKSMFPLPSTTMSSMLPLPSIATPSILLVPKSVSISSRAYFSKYDDGDSVLSHLDREGKARMVDVGDKDVTSRVAAAECFLHVGGRLLRLLKDAKLPKGDALTVAQIAGVIAAKKTSDLIPMCHPLPLDCVRVNVYLPKGDDDDGGNITIRCEVRCTARTGAEMEALTGAAIAALALYDMCKSVDKCMKVTNLRVVRKTGGKSGDWPPTKQPDPHVRDLDRSPIKPKEVFAPINMMT